jgi:KUP system potassium uptake protein
VIVLSVSTAQTPHAGREQQISLQKLGSGIYIVQLRYGFMQDPNVPETLSRGREAGAELDPEDTTYFLGRETIIVTERPGMAMWREKLFTLMAKNAVRATAYFRLPLERVVELGVQVEM